MARTLHLALLVIALLITPTVAAQEQQTVTLRVEGMVCPLCEQTVESVLTSIDGVAAAKADRQSETAVATFDPARAAPAEMVRAINAQTYYQASLLRSSGRAEAAAEVATAPDDKGPSLGLFAGLGLAALVLAGAPFLLRRKRRARAEAAHPGRSASGQA